MSKCIGYAGEPCPDKATSKTHRVIKKRCDKCDNKRVEANRKAFSNAIRIITSMTKELK